jgi:hypothetical protein
MVSLGRASLGPVIFKAPFEATFEVTFKVTFDLLP